LNIAYETQTRYDTIDGHEIAVRRFRIPTDRAAKGATIEQLQQSDAGCRKCPNLLPMSGSIEHCLEVAAVSSNFAPTWNTLPTRFCHASHKDRWLGTTDIKKLITFLLEPISGKFLPS
jgi:hypothetical protein